MDNSDSIDLHRTSRLTARKGLLFKRASRMALALLLSWLSIAQAADFSGKVVRVIDGDTIEVLHHGQTERIHLNGIDCPEKGQAYGQNAKQAASALVFEKDVMLQTVGKDQYGRTFADVRLLDGTHVNHTLVKDGWCWWYRKYAPRNRELERLEKNAREAKKGLWVASVQVPPWEWRKRTR